MHRPARTIAVLGLDAQRGVVIDQYAQQVALAFFEVGKGADAEGAQPFLAHLPLDAPDILFAAPQIEEPRLGAFLLNLIDLVVDAQHEFAFAEAEGLHLAVLAVLVVLAGRRNEVVLIEVDGLDLVVEGEIDPRQAFRLKGGEADRRRPIEKAPVQFGRAELPEGETAIGDEEVRLVEFAELDAEAIVLDQEGISLLTAFGELLHGEGCGIPTGYKARKS